jgi:hypothetical protein
VTTSTKKAPRPAAHPPARGHAVLARTVPRRLYHLTPARNLVRVRARGLRPRSSRWGEARRRSYANRVYFTTSASGNARMRAVLAREDTVLGKRTRPDEYLLLVVDPARIPRCRLYVDPEHPRSSVYVTQPVPPAAITVAGGARRARGRPAR